MAIATNALFFALVIAGAGALEVNKKTVSSILLSSSALDSQEGSSVEIKAAPAVEPIEALPVPTASRCIVIICCQYMIIYAALAACRTYCEFTGQAKGKAEAGLRAAAQTVTYGPMLCVLFLACRMRVEYLSNGKGEPQGWVQGCMVAVTFAVLASTVLVLFVPFAIGKPVQIKEGTCDLEKMQEPQEDDKITFYVLTAARYLIMLGLYGGLAGVIMGIFTYVPPGLASSGPPPSPAPAVMCTMILSVVFFVTQVVVAGCRSYTEFTGMEFPRVVGIMHAAAATVEFAPMLSILFLAARMRALQHDGQPQAWATDCMYFATGGMCLTTILSIAVPLALAGTMKINPVTRETTFDVPDPKLGYVLLALRYFCMMSFYGGAIGVACSVYAFEAPAGASATLPLSPTVQCVMNLSCQFFFVYFMTTVMMTISEVSGGVYTLEKSRFFVAIESSKATLALAPMLAILFITTRMYALLITGRKGAPQGWVQDGMHMSTWSLMISLVACLLTGLVMEKVETDEDGNVVNKFSNQYVAIAATIVRYTSMFLLYGGVVLVIIGMFIMTAETANGRGSIPLLSDAVDSTRAMTAQQQMLWEYAATKTGGAIGSFHA